MVVIVFGLEMLFGFGRAMAQRPLGIDVSSYQGSSFNWTSAKSSGISFAWAKATEGTTNYYYDADFAINEANAKAAGVLIGAYHYARFDLNPGTAGAAAEAGWFWQKASTYIKASGGYLMPMLDVEASSVGYSKTALSQWVNAWCQTVASLAAASGIVVRPVIYSSSSFAGNWFNSSVTQWIPWIANWNGQNPQTGSPTPYSPWSTWTVWQYTDAASVAGHNVDGDVFNGTATQLTNALVISTLTATVYWDPGYQNASPGSGGSGTWDNSTPNWWLQGTGDTAWSAVGDSAVFAAPSGTVTLGASVASDSLTFSAGGYVIAGSATLTLNSPGKIVLPAGSTTSINCVLGGVAYTLSGGGTLVLNNAGNYSAGETVIGPNTTLAVATDHDSGNIGVILNLENGGIYRNNDSTSGDQFLLPDCSVALLTGGGIFANPNADLTMSNHIAGSGSLTIMGTSHILTLSGANTYTGKTAINGGLLQINADTRLGAAPGSPVANQVTLNTGGISSGLRCSGSFTLSANRGITLLGSGGSVQATSGQTVTYPCIITGSGNLGIGSAYNLGYGINVFTAANNYAGTTTIAAGTLRLGADGTLPAGTPLTIAADSNTGGGGVFDLNGHSQSIGPLASSTGIGGAGTDTPTIKLTGALTVLQTNVNTTFTGVITGSGGSLTLNGTGKLTLSGANTYTGVTTISAGTLALAGTGSINDTASIGLAAGGTFDVSAIANYTLSSSTTLSAGGTAAPATIKGGTTINLGSQPIILTYDGSHPALFISQGVLSLNGNAFTINGSVLPPGTYTLVQQASGSVASSGTFAVSGTAIGADETAAIAVSGGNVLLTILNSTATMLNPLTTITYGQSATFTANVSPTPPGGTVQFYDNGATLGDPIMLTGGTASYSTNTLSVGNHPITASYSGTTGYAASSTLASSIQQVTLASNTAPVIISVATILGNGAVQMNFTGIPGYTYLIQATTDLSPPVTWTNLSTNVADINGLFSFTDLDATNHSYRYYRTAVQ